MATNNKKDGLPTKQQLLMMMQRYSSVQIVPLDNEQKPITIKSDTANFKKPIFFDTDCGKVMQKIMMGLKEQAFFPPNNGEKTARVVLEGNLGLVQKTMAAHLKAQGNDPYNPKPVFENKIELYEGISTITESDLCEEINDEYELQEYLRANGVQTTDKS